MHLLTYHLRPVEKHELRADHHHICYLFRKTNITVIFAKFKHDGLTQVLAPPHFQNDMEI
jgi:hypothetical protein